MNRRPLALSGLLITVLAAPAAWSCPVPYEEEPDVFPSRRASVQLPLSAAIYLEAGTERDLLEPPAFDQPHLSELVHPDGTPVQWEVEPSDFSDRVSQARPVGGWQVGEYWAKEAPEVEGSLVYTVVDAVDGDPPALLIEGWTGESEAPHPPAPCSSDSGGRAGVELQLAAMDEPIVLLYALHDADGELLRDGFFFYGDPSSPRPSLSAPAGWTVDVQLEAIDLSGNRATDSTSDLVACTGCSGSVAGGHATPLTVLAWGLIGGLRRRRRG